MQLLGFRPTLECEMFEKEASRLHSCSTTRQYCGPSPPLLAIELLQGQGSLLFELGFAAGEEMQQEAGHGVLGFAQTTDPLLHHLRISQFSQLAEEALPCSLHLFPSGIGVHNEKPIGHRAAAAQGYS